MRHTKVKDLMIPLSEFASVSEEASLYEAVRALEEAHQEYNKRRVPYRAILVLDKNDQIVGKLSELDVLRGLEPGYKSVGDLRSTSMSGLHPDFLKLMIKNFSLWQKPLMEICAKASRIKVKDIDHTPIKDKDIDQDASLEEAINLLIVGQHNNLLVTKAEGKEIVGVLRLNDLFDEVSDRIKACEL